MPERIELPNGETVTAEEREFDALDENASLYELDDGTIVSLRPVVSKMYRVLDEEDGTPALTSEGEPYVLVKHSTFIAAEEGEEA